MCWTRHKSITPVGAQGLAPLQLEIKNFRAIKEISLDFTDLYGSPILQDIDPWFKSQLMEQAEKSKNHILALNSMLNDALQEDIWKLSTDVLNNELNHVDPKQEEIFFQQAKIFFRGKEALRYLFNWAYTHLSICNLSYDEFIII